MRLKTIALCAFIGLRTLSAQQHECGTDAYLKEYYKQHPGLEEAVMKEAEAMRFRAESPRRATKFVIPVVFHVYHTNGPEKISKEQIFDQMRILNQDFSYTNGNKSRIRSQFTGVAADCEIEFRLARIDPNGNCTDGINYIYTPEGVDADDAEKSLSRWNYTKYLNIWVVSSILNKDPGSTGIVLGRAVFPWATSSAVDGILIRADRVGTNGYNTSNDSGSTLTHEIGHWLGLWHTFQDGCNGGDFIDDTPPVASAFVNANCPANGNSCTNDALPDQWENYMDYSDGSCQAMFTLKQRARMQAILSGTAGALGSRASNVSSANLLATGVSPNTTVAPVANFSSTKTVVCVGDPVTFYDQSCKGSVTSRTWSFDGADISATNAQNPTVRYAAPGKYTVSLQVGNSINTSKLTRNAYIEVRPSAAAVKPALIEGFENGFPAGWSSLSAAGIQWSVAGTGFSGTKSYKTDITGSTPAGVRYQFETPAIDLRPIGTKSPKISFMVGYRPRTANVFETIRVYYSRDCSNNWTQFLLRTGSMIAGSSTATPDFVPSLPADWKMVSFTLSQFANDSNIAFRFEVENAGGNPVYIDDINISSFNTSVAPLSAELIGLEVFPNPARDQISLSFGFDKTEAVTVHLRDLTGKNIAELYRGTTVKGDNLLNIGSGKLGGIAPGLYFLELNFGGKVILQKISLQP